MTLPFGFTAAGHDLRREQGMFSLGEWTYDVGDGIFVDSREDAPRFPLWCIKVRPQKVKYKLVS